MDQYVLRLLSSTTTVQMSLKRLWSGEGPGVCVLDSSRSDDLYGTYPDPGGRRGSGGERHTERIERRGARGLGDREGGEVLDPRMSRQSETQTLSFP